jgi:hypothetical protein
LGVELVNAGGIPLLFSALERHNTNYRVVICALRAITNHIAFAEKVEDYEIQDLFDTYLSNYIGCLRTIDNAERAMDRISPGDFQLRVELFYTRKRLQVRLRDL